MNAVRALAVTAPVLALLAGCGPVAAGTGPTTYLDCLTQVVTAAAEITVDLDTESADDPALTCTVKAGDDAGSVLTLGRNRNVVQVVRPDGQSRKQYAGTYFDCIDLVSTRELDVCMVGDGPDAGRELALDAAGEVAFGPAVAR